MEWEIAALSAVLLVALFWLMSHVDEALELLKPLAPLMGPLL